VLVGLTVLLARPVDNFEVIGSYAALVGILLIANTLYLVVWLINRAEL